MPTDVSYWGIVDVWGRTKKVQLISHNVSQPVSTAPQVQLPVATVATKLVHSLREELEQVKKEKNRLESQLQEKMEQLHTEQRENKELQTRIRETETMNQKQEMENEKLLAKNQQLQVETQDFQRNVARMSIENMRLNEQVKELKKRTTDESWKVNYKEVTLTKQELGRGGWGASDMDW